MPRFSVVNIEALKRKYSRTARGSADAPRRTKPVHHEDREARALWRWACTQPKLADLYHIPNGGKRGKIEAARMKSMGVRAGVHDFHLPNARGGYIGCWIELKAAPPHTGTISAEQRVWGGKMEAAGHYVRFCFGWIDAKKELERYINMMEIRPL